MLVQIAADARIFVGARHARDVEAAHGRDPAMIVGVARSYNTIARMARSYIDNEYEFIALTR